MKRLNQMTEGERTNRQVKISKVGQGKDFRRPVPTVWLFFFGLVSSAAKNLYQNVGVQAMSLEFGTSDCRRIRTQSEILYFY